jgi:hypothetical protein
MLRGVVELTRYNTTIPGLVALYCVLSAEATDRDHPAHEYFQRRYNWVRGTMTEAFDELARQGQLRSGIAPSTAAGQLVALMDGLQVQWLLDNDSVDMPAEVVAFLEVITTEKF